MDTLAKDLRKLSKCLREKSQNKRLLSREKSAKILKASKAIKMLKDRIL